jgi:plastocyanin
LVGFLAACETPQSGTTLVLDSSEVSIAGRVHDVRIAGARATDSIAPLEVIAAPGDAVQFIMGDRRPHALAFVMDSLSPGVRAYLERTGQLRGPPLVNQGSRWIVLLEGAPPGRYPFVCRAHDAHGTLVVVEGE